MSRLYLWFNPCALFYRISAHGTAGAVGARLPRALCFQRRANAMHNPDTSVPRDFEACNETAPVLTKSGQFHSLGGDREKGIPGCIVRGCSKARCRSSASWVWPWYSALGRMGDTTGLSRSVRALLPLSWPISSRPRSDTHGGDSQESLRAG